MSGKTGIEWTRGDDGSLGYSWNPVVGCTKVSQGCKLCYAKTVHDRRHQAFLEGKNVAPQYSEPFERVQLKPDRLTWPLSLRKPSRIFVNSVSDLFHEEVPDDFIERVFATMALAQRHTFLVLTKRPERMKDWFALRCGLETIEESVSRIAAHVGKIIWDSRGSDYFRYNRCTPADVANRRPWPGWPLPNVQIGVSVENQEAADERIPLLLQTPAAVRFLSCEPLLGPLDLEGGDAYPSKGWLRGWHAEQQHSRECSAERGCVCQGEAVQVQNGQIDWVIVGGESGSSKQNPRPMAPSWVRSVRDQCVAAGVPFLFKQWGDWVGNYFGGQSWEPDENTPSHYFDPPDGKAWRVGKKRAGRELDGRTWDEYPQAKVAP